MFLCQAATGFSIISIVTLSLILKTNISLLKYIWWVLVKMDNWWFGFWRPKYRGEIFEKISGKMKNSFYSDHWMVLNRHHELWAKSPGVPTAFRCSLRKPDGAKSILCSDSWNSFSSSRLAQSIGVWERCPKVVISSPASSLIQEAGGTAGQKQSDARHSLTLLCSSVAGSQLRVAQLALYLWHLWLLCKMAVPA